MRRADSQERVARVRSGRRGRAGARALLAAAAIALCGSAAPAAVAFDSTIPTVCPLAPRSGVGPESKAAAQADAGSLLGELPLPAGSSESATEPAEDGSLLARPGEGPPATPNAVDDHGWWLVPGGPAEALDYVCTHLPPGTVSTTISDGGVSGPDTPENTIGVFALPGTPGTLVVWAVRLPDGSTGLRADAQVVWRTPRAASETLPSGAHLLRITVRDRSRNAGVDSRQAESEALRLLERLPAKVTSAARIEAVVALLNRLGVAQPGLRHCPVELDETSVKLSFQASPDAVPSAVVDIQPGGCGGVGLTLGGIAEPPLEGGGELVSEIGRALKVNPDIGPPVGQTPRLSRVRMTRARFPSSAETGLMPGVESGTRFLFDLSAPAEVSVAISRLPAGVRYADTCGANAARPRRLRRPNCVPTAVLERLTRSTEIEGEDGIAFSGKYGRHALAPGRYVAVLDARSTGGSSRPAGVEFTITR